MRSKYAMTLGDLHLFRLYLGDRADADAARPTDVPVEHYNALIKVYPEEFKAWRATVLLAKGYDPVIKHGEPRSSTAFSYDLDLGDEHGVT